MIRAISKYWWVFTLRGLIAIAFGLASLLWPALTLGVMVLLFGLFALFEGGLTIVTSFKKGDEKGGWTLAGNGSGGQRRRPAFFHGPIPSPHRSDRGADPVRDFRHGQAALQERDGPPPSLLQRLRRAVGSHAP